MSPLSLPWTFSKDDPAGPDFENRLQDVMDTVAQQFPVSGSNLANDVLKLATTGTSRKVAFGAASLTWTASASSAHATVTHGLGTTPVAVVATGNSGLSVAFYALVATVGSTTFDLQGIATAVTTSTQTAYWVAIG